MADYTPNKEYLQLICNVLDSSEESIKYYLEKALHKCELHNQMTKKPKEIICKIQGN